MQFRFTCQWRKEEIVNSFFFLIAFKDVIIKNRLKHSTEFDYCLKLYRDINFFSHISLNLDVRSR